MAKQTFTAGNVLTAAEMNSLQENDYNWTVDTKTASYTLAAGDEGTRIVMNNAGATTITVDDAVFAAGDVVWLHNIGAGICTVTAGTATVNTLGELALEQYAGGHLYFTSASEAIFFPTEQGVTKILQIVSTTKSDTFSASVSAGNFTAVTGLSLTITPSSASSTILLYGSVNGSWSASTSLPYSTWRFTRGGSAVGVGDTEGSRSSITAMMAVPGTTFVSQGNASMMYLDSPATTSATTYAIDVLNFDSSTQTIYVNRPAGDGNTATYTRAISTIIALEVSA